MSAQPGFTKGNRYLFAPWVHTWNLPSGYTCPGARECLAFAERETGYIKTGPHNTFRCYSAVTERFPAVRAKAWANHDLVFGRTTDEIVAAIVPLMPRGATHVRIHAGGDFFNQAYFDAWLAIVAQFPNCRYWAFTKSTHYWVQRLCAIPGNLNLTASYGGKHDALIEQYNLKSARVVYSVEEAERLGLQIDTDDRMAAYGSESFALLENFTRLRK